MSLDYGISERQFHLDQSSDDRYNLAHSFGVNHLQEFVVLDELLIHFLQDFIFDELSIIVR